MQAIKQDPTGHLASSESQSHKRKEESLQFKNCSALYKRSKDIGSTAVSKP